MLITQRIETLIMLGVVISLSINCIDQNNCDRRYDTDVKISNDGGEWRDKLLQWTRKKRLREREEMIE